MTIENYRRALISAADGIKHAREATFWSEKQREVYLTDIEHKCRSVASGMGDQMPDEESEWGMLCQVIGGDMGASGDVVLIGAGIPKLFPAGGRFEPLYLKYVVGSGVKPGPGVMTFARPHWLDTIGIGKPANPFNDIGIEKRGRIGRFYACDDAHKNPRKLERTDRFVYSKDGRFPCDTPIPLYR